MSGRDDRLSPATYTVGEVRDLAEKIFVAMNGRQGLPLDYATAAANASIDRAHVFAQAWAKSIEVKP